MTRLRLLARVALFSALIYVVNYALVWIPNVKLGYFIIFSAGYLWGIKAGVAIGAVGQGLFTIFNPFGPAALPVMAAQIIGGGAMGAVGNLWRTYRLHEREKVTAIFLNALGGIVCTLAFFIPVNVVEAWVLQPFWPQLIGSVPFTLIALGSNVVIFPLLFPMTAYLYRREWHDH